MVKYIIKRILYSILILFFVSVLIYFLVRCLPTDYIDNKFADKLGQGQITQEQIDDIKRMYGLLDNSFFGILSGYFTWLSNVLKLDLGTSFKFELPVAEVIGEYMWISFGISLVAMVLQFLIAIPLGVMSATHQYGPMDYVVTIFTMIGISLPSFFLATLLIKVFSTTLGWLPMQGLTDAMKDYTGLAKHTTGTWYYVELGRWIPNFSGMVEYNGKYYPVRNGKKAGSGKTVGQMSTSELREAAQTIAKWIAADAKNYSSDKWDQAAYAAAAVSVFCEYSEYTTEGKYYREAWGPFVAGEYSCAGATRATGMVLDYLGISWSHANANQWTHQWCNITINGVKGWADGQIGEAGVGEYPYA